MSSPSEQHSPGSEAFGQIEDALWRQFGTTDSEATFANTWLALQCRLIQGVNAGVVLLGSPGEGRPFALAGAWPGGPQDMQHLARIAERALGERKGLVVRRRGEERNPSGYDAAYPVQVDGNVRGVVALELEPRGESELRAVMRQLQWGSAWMEVLVQRGRKAADGAPRDRLELVVAMLATLVSQEGFRGSGTALATELATRLDCDRVSVGFLHRGNARVEAVSHSAQFGRDMNLVRTIAAAMDEAIDQGGAVAYPEPGGGPGGRVSRAAAELVRESGNRSVSSIPLTSHGRVVGALTFERASETAFDSGTIEILESVGALVGPILEVQRRDDRWLVTRAFYSLRGLASSLVGPRHVGLKLGAVGALALVLLAVFATGDFRVTADTVVEPARRQAIAAAFDGYVRTAPFRAGDVVPAGEVLATLDDRDLQLERTRWQSQADQGQRQYQAALGTANAAEVQIFAAQIEQARAQVGLLDEQLARTRITAPFDGVIVTGDLSQSLASPVGRGDVLFELAPLDEYRVILEVDERDVRHVEEGQSGQIVLAGFTEEPLPFRVRRLTPVSTAAEGRNYFRVEAELDEVPERLRPGMEGVGKIRIDERRLVWIWSREILDWARLKTWTWLP